MGYVEKVLAPGEQVLRRTRRHGIALLRGVGGAPKSGPPSTSAGEPPAGAETGAAARLAELEDLRRRDLVTEDEYRAKRAAVLERL